MLKAHFDSTASSIAPRLRDDGCVLLDAAGLRSLTSLDVKALESLRSSWSSLPPDPHLRDGGSYRRRRHACFLVHPTHPAQATLERVPPRAHYQPVDYNALHGGFERWFEPIDASVIASPAWSQLVVSLGVSFAGAFAGASGLRAVNRWHVEAHQFRIDCAGGVGRPTPEGAHRDGVDFVAVVLVERHAVKGGETRVFEADGPNGIRFTLREPFSALLLDDARVVHETSPIQPENPQQQDGFRDTLVLTYRAAGFQAPT